MRRRSSNTSLAFRRKSKQLALKSSQEYTNYCSRGRNTEATMAALAPTVKLNNGKLMPVLGLGTWLVKHNEGKELIKAAIDAGYRHFDTALLYHSEKSVGEGIKEKIADGTIKREDVFVTTKLWCTYTQPGMVTKACKLSLQNLGLDYIDLYLIHWPFSFKPVADPTKLAKEWHTIEEVFNVTEYFPKNESGELIMTDTDYVDVWKGMEECVAQGMAKSIGISNFNEQQIERLLKSAKIKPVTNQVEVHPYLNQKKLIEFCRKNDITVTAYGPLGLTLPVPVPGLPRLVENPDILKIAERRNKTPAQIILRYLIQLNTIVIPKTGNSKRLVENISVFDFSLTPQEMAEMDSVNRDLRICKIPGTENHKFYSFEKS